MRLYQNGNSQSSDLTLACVSEAARFLLATVMSFLSKDADAFKRVLQRQDYTSWHSQPAANVNTQLVYAVDYLKVIRASICVTARLTPYSVHSKSNEITGYCDRDKHTFGYRCHPPGEIQVA